MELLLAPLLGYFQLLLFQLLLEVLAELFALTNKCGRHVVEFGVFVGLGFEGVVLLLFSDYFVPLFFELLLGGGVAHVLGEELLAEVLGEGLGDFVDLGLECVLSVVLLLFHFPYHFLLLSVLGVQALHLVRLEALGVTLANDLAGQVDLWLEGALRLVSVLLIDDGTVLLLLLEESSLPRVEVFEVAVEHGRALSDGP